MTCNCHIIPDDVLRRLADDNALTDEQRQSFSDTAAVDTEFRKLRFQAGRLSRVSNMVAPLVGNLAAAPTVTLYNCNHLQSLPGAPVARPKSSSDATVKRAFAETTSLAKFYSQVFGRNSIDDFGMTLMSSVHYGTNYNNAFWNGSQMAYGDGDGKIFLDFTKGNDVIGHEITHGVTQFTLQLTYSNEPGGLNESLSDCFGSMFRQWEANQTVAKADWLIGKDIMGQQALAKGYTCLRDMANPAATHCLAPQPTHFSQYTRGMDPHYSSGIPNFAFYKICIAVGGKSWEKVGQIWYTAMTAFGPSPNLKMKSFANRTRKTASQLYPKDPGIAAAVDQGWKQVGL